MNFRLYLFPHNPHISEAEYREQGQYLRKALAVYSSTEAWTELRQKIHGNCVNYNVATAREVSRVVSYNHLSESDPKWGEITTPRNCFLCTPFTDYVSVYKAGHERDF